MILTIGKQIITEVSSLEEASRIYCDLREESGEGMRTFSEGKIKDGKKAIFRISYNGKVWINKTWEQGDSPVYNPYN